MYITTIILIALLASLLLAIKNRGSFQDYVDECDKFQKLPTYTRKEWEEIEQSDIPTINIKSKKQENDMLERLEFVQYPWRKESGFIGLYKGKKVIVVKEGIAKMEKVEFNGKVYYFRKQDTGDYDDIIILIKDSDIIREKSSWFGTQ